ncbi:hypothetical protein GBA65_21755 (plasmid) [Rubrobacter marinus]|uniref:Uncharacterized protein n=1 Tax=Rubrobacter marinus TaxID=2653852 RepID=A0A6G8Q3N4_9ACTN|nr:hypothetical protein [Rubrobacter marinus]QIN81066.1 hypothetical protein GBA65_21755 [Rubrobacter marinus]
MRDEFMITRQGKQFVLFAGLLDEAHARGLKAIDTDLVQVPTPENGQVAIVKATVEMEDGKAFSGIGDASPDNVGRMIAQHTIRMAETRAKARALRDAVNVGVASLEEMSDGDDVPSPPVAQESSRSQSRTNSSVQAVPNAAANGLPPNDEQQAPSEKKGTKQKARKSQVDLLRTLAEELRGENGVARLEGRIGKSLTALTREEADLWIDRLTPAEGREAASGE